MGGCARIDGSAMVAQLGARIVWGAVVGSDLRVHFTRNGRDIESSASTTVHGQAWRVGQAHARSVPVRLEPAVPCLSAQIRTSDLLQCAPLAAVGPTASSLDRALQVCSLQRATTNLPRSPRFVQKVDFHPQDFIYLVSIAQTAQTKSDRPNPTPRQKASESHILPIKNSSLGKDPLALVCAFRRHDGNPRAQRWRITSSQPTDTKAASRLARAVNTRQISHNIRASIHADRHGRNSHIKCQDQAQGQKLTATNPGERVRPPGLRATTAAAVLRTAKHQDEVWSGYEAERKKAG